MGYGILAQGTASFLVSAGAVIPSFRSNLGLIRFVKCTFRSRDALHVAKILAESMNRRLNQRLHSWVTSINGLLGIKLRGSNLASTVAVLLHLLFLEECLITTQATILFLHLLDVLNFVFEFLLELAIH